MGGAHKRRKEYADRMPTKRVMTIAGTMLAVCGVAVNSGYCRGGARCEAP
jgi:hypothetical protein